MLEFLADLLSSILGGELGLRWGRRSAKRRNAGHGDESKTAASVRLVEGSVRGLTHQWMPAVWSIAPGRLTNFSVVVRVVEIDPATPRTPGFREAWSVDPDAEIYRASSDAAVVEIALMPEQSAWVIRALLGRGDAPGPAVPR